MNARMWLEAARPKTWSAAFVPVAVGTASVQRIFVWRALGALVVALFLQIAVNFANDYFDGVRGIDDERRAGPRRFTATGAASPASMKIAIGVAISIALITGVAVASRAGWELMIVGLVAVVAALGYSGGPRPYASAGLGEVFVFIFFGLVATAGSRYVHSKDLPLFIWVAGSSVGFLATAILIVNNLRDLATDARAGKRTLAVRLGERRTRSMFHLLLVLAFAGVPVVAALTRSTYPLLALLALPFAWPASKAVRTSDPAGVAPALGATSKLHMVFGALLALGLWF